jgi:hypothetical protein
MLQDARVTAGDLQAVATSVASQVEQSDAMAAGSRIIADTPANALLAWLAEEKTGSQVAGSSGIRIGMESSVRFIDYRGGDRGNTISGPALEPVFWMSLHPIGSHLLTELWQAPVLDILFRPPGASGTLGGFCLA